MRKSILASAIIILSISAAMNSCTAVAANPDSEQDSVAEANKNIDKPADDYLADIDNYRKETAGQIASNDKGLDEFKMKVEGQKNEAKVEYKERLADLEKKNAAMKRRMDDYKAEGKSNWAVFKTSYKHDMDDLRQSFWDLKNNF